MKSKIVGAIGIISGIVGIIGFLINIFQWDDEPTINYPPTDNNQPISKTQHVLDSYTNSIKKYASIIDGWTNLDAAVVKEHDVIRIKYRKMRKELQKCYSKIREGSTYYVPDGAIDIIRSKVTWFNEEYECDLYSQYINFYFKPKFKKRGAIRKGHGVIIAELP